MVMQDNLERKPVKNIDFNIDLAQSFGIYKNNSEFDLLDYASSVNISCGFHAGDPMTIKNALLKAKEKNVVVGAHIGFDDIQGFGYRDMDLTDDEIEALVIYQVGALMSFAKTFNMEIEHVRPHGAMYKRCASDFSFACAVAKAVQKCSKWLVYYGASGEITEKTGELLNIPVAHEICLEKMYNVDGTVNTVAKDNENVEVKIGFMDGKVMDLATIKSMSALGSMDEVRAKFIGLLKAPGSQLARVLNAYQTKLNENAGN